MSRIRPQLPKLWLILRSCFFGRCSSDSPVDASRVAATASRYLWCTLYRPWRGSLASLPYGSQLQCNHVNYNRRLRMYEPIFTFGASIMTDGNNLSSRLVWLARRDRDSRDVGHPATGNINAVLEWARLRFGKRPFFVVARCVVCAPFSSITDGPAMIVFISEEGDDLACLHL